MNIIFTKHALERIKERKIKIEIVIDTLRSPDKTFKNKETTKYVKKINSKVIVVIASLKNNSIKIITVFKSSKINKYLES